MAKKPLYREEAVQAHRDPEQRKELLRSIAPSTGVIYTLLLLLFVGAVTALIVVRVPTIVRAQGVLQQEAAGRTVHAPTSGVVQKLSVTVGSTVHQGAPIVSFDTTLLDVRLKRAQREQAQQEQALRKLQALKTDAPTPKLILGIAEQQQRVSRARGRVEELATQRGMLSLKAPESGRVATVLVTEGSFVREGEPLLTIIQPDSPLVGYMLVPGKYRTTLTTGMPVRLALDGVSNTGRGRVEQVGVTPAPPGLIQSLTTRSEKAADHLLVRVRLEQIPEGCNTWNSRGVPFSGQVEIRRRRLVALLFPPLEHLMD
jgi:multidrug efflux pump subunit AcrA (membrane-fusion protein)